MSIAEGNYRSPRGQHIASVGPLVTTAGTAYTAAHMEEIMYPARKRAFTITLVPKQYTRSPVKSA